MQGRPSTRLLIARLLIAVTLTAMIGPVLTGVAIAQPAPPPGPDAAEQAYREGRRHYDLQEWDDAIAQFKLAYRLRSDAASLFNIAQSYRLKGDCVSASSFYKTYRRNFPAAPNLAKVDKFVGELEACVRERSSSLPSPPVPGSSTTTPASTATSQEPTGTVPVIDGMPGTTGQPRERAPIGQDPTAQTEGGIGPIGPVGPVDDPGRRIRNTGLLFVGAGAIAVGAGVVFGVQALAKSSDVERGSGTWNPELEDQGKRDQTLAIGLAVVGGAAVVAGSVLYYVGWKQQLGHVAVAPRASGASMVWSCAF